MTDVLDAAKTCQIHLLDVGRDEYGDAVFCQFGKRFVLIDGAHPGDQDGTPGHASIPDQIKRLSGKEKPYPIDLLIITHAHQDHIGCLPRLINEEQLKVGWVLSIDPKLGWGRSGNEDALRDADPNALKLAAALREEVRSERGTPDFALDQFLTDAVSLESSYKKMLELLEASGSKVIRFGNPHADIKGLEEEFADIKLKILGPSSAHLLECAELIGKNSLDSVKLMDSIFKRDVAMSPAQAYRQAVSSLLNATDGADEIDAAARPGPLINLQSIVTQFEYAGHKFLFAGDFQFAKPQTKNEVIVAGVGELKTKIKTEAPYSFVKLSHHGSDNAFSEEMLTDLGETKFFGLCAGEESSHHPSRKILELLEKHKQDIKWARTDHNGLVTLVYQKGQKEPEIKLEKGILNDTKPNFIDLTASISPNILPAESVSSTEKTAPSSKESITKVPGEESRPNLTKRNQSEINQGIKEKEFIEITAKIPHSTAEIKFSGNFTFGINTAEHSVDENIIEPPSMGTTDYDPTFLIGGGRGIIRDLLFVTSAEKLKENIGQSETQKILSAFEIQEIPLFHELPVDLKNSTEAAGYVRQKLNEYPDIKGVVIIGGYDVVPAQILDSLPTNLRNVLPPNDDPDNFIVWNDEIYGDRDGDGLPEIPVSRIPDGRSAKLVFNALQTGESRSGRAKFGIRNIYRPFAVDVFNKIPGNEDLYISKNTVFNQEPPLHVEAEQVYFMLHGDYRDSSRFWGEETPSNREAFHVYNLPKSFRGVVFAGCCWGALTVDTPAGRSYPNRPFSLNTVESSIALSFLERGANAFVGCTGAHYSPTEPPFDYFGGPLHAAFWHFYNIGFAPAVALFNAKIEFIKQMPHGRTTVIQQAIEYKILRQFTCLGLGW